MKPKHRKPTAHARATTAALRRASKRALAEAIATGTPFYVWQDGKVVDLNARPRRRSALARRPGAKRTARSSS